MRKSLIALFVLALAGFAGNAAAVEGDFELSGHVNTGFGYQAQNSKASSGLMGASGSFHGALGDLGTNHGRGAKIEQIIAFVDEAELDATKSFGENVRARADFAYGRAASGSNAAIGAFQLEQAYATVNIPVGNGMEFLLGRFDLPIGFESLERNENTLFSNSSIRRELLPDRGTGLKFYYPFSDMVDLHFYIVNNLHDSIGTAAGAALSDNHWPSFGSRLGFSWGDWGRRSTIGVSLAAGMESAQGIAAGKLGNLSYLGDVDWNVWVSEFFAIGGEGIYRMDNANSGQTDGTYFGGTLALNYVFSDVWDGTLRYTFAMDKAGIGATAFPNGAATGTSLLNASAVLAISSAAKTTVHEVALGGQYHIADGAKLQIEGRYDMVKNATAGAGTGGVYGGAMAFLYNF